MTNQEATALSKREEALRAIRDADTLSDLSGDVCPELLDAARAEAAVPTDETDEG
jgi:hypothetical protein